VDALQNALLANQKIRFQYFRWNVKKESELRRDGEYYEVSPWALTWDDENYYLIGFDARDGMIKHYRVDKMLKISPLKEKREGREYFEKFDMAAYAKKSFGMYGGEEQYVKLLCENGLAGVIIDRFGKDVMMVPVDEGHFHANVNVAVSDPFLGWVYTLGEGIKIVGPEGVVEQMKDKLSKTLELYK
jgi:predicted DNA-binding transcriptional regulator YafY